MLSNLNAKVKQMHSGGNHSATIIRDNHQEIGQAVWDPARAQFAFMPTDHDITLSASDKTAIVAILNSLSQ